MPTEPKRFVGRLLRLQVSKDGQAPEIVPTAFFPYERAQVMKEAYEKNGYKVRIIPGEQVVGYR